jgi:hypothetical protein
MDIPCMTVKDFIFSILLFPFFVLRWTHPYLINVGCTSKKLPYKCPATVSETLMFVLFAFSTVMEFLSFALVKVKSFLCLTN